MPPHKGLSVQATPGTSAEPERDTGPKSREEGQSLRPESRPGSGAVTCLGACAPVRTRAHLPDDSQGLGARGLPCGPRPSIPSRKVPPKLPRTGRLQLGVSLPTIPRAGPPTTGRALLPLARAGVSPGAEGGPPPARPDHQQASRPHPKVLTCPEAALSAQQHEPQHEPPSRHVPPSRRPAVPPSPRNRRPRHYKNRSAAGRAHAGGVAGGGAHGESATTCARARTHVRTRGPG